MPLLLPSRAVASQKCSVIYKGSSSIANR
eukprot:SAG11_NODE_4537_length_1860_cov_2.444634_1_plen_28_part_10